MTPVLAGLQISAELARIKSRGNENRVLALTGLLGVIREERFRDREVEPSDAEQIRKGYLL